MRNKDFNTLSNGYKVAMKWLKDNAMVTTFTLEWEQITGDSNCVIIVNSNTHIDNYNQIQTRYRLTVLNGEVVKVDYTNE